MYITIERYSPDKLRRVEWSFSVSDMHPGELRVFLTDWRELTRPSRRHKNWRAERRWGRTSERDNRPHGIEKPIVPHEVHIELVRTIMDKLNYTYEVES